MNITLDPLPIHRYDNLKAEVVVLTPDEARRLRARTLELRDLGLLSPRDLNPRTVSRYRRVLREGRWGLSDSVLVVNKEGGLDNGNHRAEAVALEGLPAPFLVMRNVDLDVSREISFNADQGRLRTIGQKLQMFAELTQDEELIPQLSLREAVFRCFEDVLGPGATGTNGSRELDYSDILAFIGSDPFDAHFKHVWEIRDSTVPIATQGKAHRLKTAIPAAAFLALMPTNPNRVGRLYQAFLDPEAHPFEDGHPHGMVHPFTVLRASTISPTAHNQRTGTNGPVNVSNRAWRRKAFLVTMLTLDRTLSGYYKRNTSKTAWALGDKVIATAGEETATRLLETYRATFPGTETP